MTLNLLILAFIILASTLYLLAIEKDKKSIIIFFFLLLATPWFFTSLLGVYRSTSTYYCNGENKNFTCLVTFEYIFFEGEKNIHRRLEDYQILLPSFIPLFLLGIYQTIISKNTRQKSLFLAFPALIVLGALKLEINFIAGLLISVPSSLLSTFGARHLINTFPRNSKTVKVFSLLLLLWIIYETLRMYQIIIIHKPFII